MVYILGLQVDRRRKNRGIGEKLMSAVETFANNDETSVAVNKIRETCHCVGMWCSNMLRRKGQNNMRSKISCWISISDKLWEVAQVLVVELTLLRLNKEKQTWSEFISRVRKISTGLKTLSFDSGITWNHNFTWVHWATMFEAMKTRSAISLLRFSSQHLIIIGSKHAGVCETAVCEWNEGQLHESGF